MCWILPIFQNPVYLRICLFFVENFDLFCPKGVGLFGLRWSILKRFTGYLELIRLYLYVDLYSIFQPE